MTFPCSVPKVSTIFTKSGALGLSRWAHSNVPLWFTSSTPFWLILGFNGWEHCDHTTGNIAKNSLNEPLRNITGAFVGKFKISPSLSQWGHPSHMTWDTVNTLQESLEWATQEHCSYILWENSRCPHYVIDGNIAIMWSGTLWVYWPFPRPEKLEEHWQGKFWMDLWCTRWVHAWYFVHFLAMYLWCTSLVHQSLPPVTIGACYSTHQPGVSCFHKQLGHQDGRPAHLLFLTDD